jgi:hypothetical protein
MATKKKTDKKAGSDPESEGELEENHENGEEHQDLESDSRKVKKGGHSPNPWDPGPGKSTAV